jgi:hypothetical protein
MGTPVNKTENVALCPHVHFTRESRAFPGTAEQWELYLAGGGLATLTSLLAHAHAGECGACATLASALDLSAEVQS